MSIGLYPGSFDPITYGHLDIIKRASKIVDKLYVAVLKNSSKVPFFTTEERTAMIMEAVKDLDNVEVCSFSGLTVDFARSVNATVMVRGLRAVTDFDYELQLSQMNRKLAPEIDTIFLTTSLQYAYLSSSSVREVAAYNGNIDEFVPHFIAEKVHEKAALKDFKK